MNRTSSRAAMLAAAALSIAGFGGTFTNAVDPGTREIRESFGQTASSQHRDATPSPSRIGERNSIAKAIFGSLGRNKPARFPNGPGWTHAHVQRMARKRRNKQRNRKAHR